MSKQSPSKMESFLGRRLTSGDGKKVGSVFVKIKDLSLYFKEQVSQITQLKDQQTLSIVGGVRNETADSSIIQ